MLRHLRIRFLLDILCEHHWVNIVYFDTTDLVSFHWVNIVYFDTTDLVSFLSLGEHSLF